MNLSSEHLGVLNYCRTLPNSLFANLSVKSMILYGSATYAGCFIDGMSDVDVLVLSEDAIPEELDKIARMISDKILTTHISAPKPPTILRDHIGDRIEFDLDYNGTIIDFTIMKSIIQSYESLTVDAVHDSVEILIGSIVMRGVIIYGEDYRGIPSDWTIFPFYNESIRQRRLMTIGEYLNPKIRRIELLLKNQDVAVIDFFFRYRAIFLKWIFCYFRQYPINFYKHLPLQLAWISGITAEDRQKILLQSADTIEKNIQNFIHFYTVCYNNFLANNDV